MSGAEFWTWFPIWLGCAVVGWRFFVAAWRDHDDDIDAERFALGAHRWPIDDEHDH